jgi:hypothetical protein
MKIMLKSGSSKILRIETRNSTNKRIPKHSSPK